MPAAKKAFVIEQYATFARRLVWKDSRGRPVNLTGCVVRMQVRDNVASNTILLEMTSQNGRILVTPLTGTIDIQLPANDTNALTWTTAVYDIKVEFPNGIEYRILEGVIRVSPGVTRDA